MFTFLKKSKKEDTTNETLTPEQPQVDFEAMVNQLTALSKSAQMTFLYRFVQTLSPNMCKTLLTYTHNRLKNFPRQDSAWVNNAIL